jgi:hypothetical protein
VGFREMAGKFYVEFKFMRDGYFETQTITQDEMIEQIGLVLFERLMKGLKNNNQEELQAFRSLLLEIASRKSDENLLLPVADLEDLVLGYLDNIENYHIEFIVPGEKYSPWEIDPQTLYVDFSNHELRFFTKSMTKEMIKEEMRELVIDKQSITEDQLKQKIGLRRCDLLTTALSLRDVAGLENFRGDILNIVSEKLDDISARNKVIHISQRAYRLFQPSLISKFLTWLTSGEPGDYKKACDMLKDNPALVFERATITISRKEFKNINALEYAGWAYDMHMLKMLLSHVPADKKRVALNVLDELEEKGINQGKHFDLTPTQTAYEAKNAAQIVRAQQDWPMHIVEELNRNMRIDRQISWTDFKQIHLPRDKNKLFSVDKREGHFLMKNTGHSSVVNFPANYPFDSQDNQYMVSANLRFITQLFEVRKHELDEIKAHLRLSKPMRSYWLTRPGD